jgi:hypothetical protein
MSKHAHLRPHSLLVLRIAGCGRRRNECACECADDCHPHARQRRPFDRLVSVPLTAIKAQAGTASYTFTLTAASPATPKPVATVEPPQSPGKALTARPPALTIVSGNDQTVVPAVAGGIADFGPLTVLLASEGRPVVDSPVLFACPKNGTLGCALNAAGATSLTVHTDASRKAT